MVTSFQQKSKRKATQRLTKCGHMKELSCTSYKDQLIYNNISIDNNIVIRQNIQHPLANQLKEIIEAQAQIGKSFVMVC